MNTNVSPMQINPVISEMEEATSIYINQLVYDKRRAGEDVITLSLGEAYFDIPLFDMVKLDVARGYHYSDSQGLPELREKLAKYYQHHYGANVDARSEILVSAGSKAIIYLAMLVALIPGDEVLIHEPAWLSYPEQARMVGATPRFIPFDCNVENFVEHITNKTKMLVICNPNNPAGRIYEKRELMELYRTCHSRGIYLLVDEAYSDFILDDGFISIAEIVPDKEGVIIVNSLSKNMGISGWRIGYSIASGGFTKELLKANQHVITCAPTLLQQYCAVYFDKLISVTLPQVRQVTEKRARVAKMMDELGLERLKGGATFYFFVSIGNFLGSSLDFAIRLLNERNIATVPGSAYGESTDRFVRVAIGAESEERIWEALQVIKDFAH